MQGNGTACKLRELSASKKDSKTFEKIQNDSYRFIKSYCNVPSLCIPISTVSCMQANGTACRLMELNASQKDLKRFKKIHKDLLNHTVMFRPCAFLFQL